MKRKPKTQTRAKAVEQAQRLLLKRGWPRLQMSLMLLLTGCAGFLVSFALLRVGVERMWLRYPLAIIAAYCGFLLLLRLWLWLHRPRSSSAPDLDPGVFDVGFPVSDALSHLGGEVGGGQGATFGGGGGDFDGGGAGGSWASVGGAGGTSSSGIGSSSSSEGGGVLGKLDLDLDLGGDDGCAVLVAALVLLLALVAALCAALYVIYAAPLLLAEVLVDGLLVAGLYRSVKNVEPRHWLRAALRRTLLPFVLALVVFTLAGYVAQRAVPEARSVGDVWRRLAVRE